MRLSSPVTITIIALLAYIAVIDIGGHFISVPAGARMAGTIASLFLGFAILVGLWLISRPEDKDEDREVNAEE